MATELPKNDIAFPLPKAPKHRRIVVDGRQFPALVLDEQNREWRLVEDFPDYEVSNDGLVRRVTDSRGRNYLKGRWLTPSIGSAGYPRYKLTDRDGQAHTVSAHRLVAAAFLPAPQVGRADVLHKNDDPRDNRDCNLKWGDQQQNWADAVRNGRIDPDRHPSVAKPWTRPRGEEHCRAKLTEPEVLAIFQSKSRQRDLALQYGVDQALIGRIRNGKVWKHLTNPQYADALKRKVRP